MTPAEIETWIYAVKKCLEQDGYGGEYPCALCECARYARRGARRGAGTIAPGIPMCEQYCICETLMHEGCYDGVMRHNPNGFTPNEPSIEWPIDACRSYLREMLGKLEEMR